MKIYIIALITLIPSLIFSQEKGTDKITTTKTKIIKVDNVDEPYYKMVKIITTKEQANKMSLKDKGEINGERVFPPIKVFKTIIVDNDSDALIDEVTKLTYYKEDKDKDTFELSDDKLINSFFDNSPISKKQLQSNPYYYVAENEDTDVGYIDNETKLLINYFSAKDKEIETHNNSNGMF